MKLIFCPDCEDMVKLLIGEMRHCKCGLSGGMYIDNVNAVIEGKAIPIGLDNHGLVTALLIHSKTVPCKFDAFIIPIGSHVTRKPICSLCENEHGHKFLQVLKNHPENQSDNSADTQGYQVYRCKICGCYWGCRYQYDRGTGSDDRWHNFGKNIDAIKRHY